MAQGIEKKDSEESSEAKTLRTLLAPYEAFVTYMPLRGEVSFRQYVALPETKLIYTVAPRASLNPSLEAKKAIAATRGASTAVLLPGRRFDASGVRHGQGGGWYDRFLSMVPQQWLRVGFCSANQFSLTPLPRNVWDQKVDIVVVAKEHTLTLHHGNRV